MRRDIVFLYEQIEEMRGSTNLELSVWDSVYMRCLQFADIVRQYAPADTYTVRCSTDCSISHAIVILTKFALFTHQHLVARLKEQHNVVLIDLIDGFSRFEELAEADGIIACSRKAFVEYPVLYPGKALFLVEHHVDTRIPKKLQQPKELAIGYFGVPENLLFSNTLATYIDVIETRKDGAFIPLLNKYPLHYALRPPLATCLCKPFIKGFTAARVRANILVHKDDGSARYYLGDDYPYLMHEAITEHNVLTMLCRINDEFQGPVWQYGLQIMRYLESISTDQYYANQFWHMIHEVES